jgi:hypothetical protein
VFLVDIVQGCGRVERKGRKEEEGNSAGLSSPSPLLVIVRGYKELRERGGREKKKLRVRVEIKKKKEKKKRKRERERGERKLEEVEEFERSPLVQRWAIKQLKRREYRGYTRAALRRERRRERERERAKERKSECFSIVSFIRRSSPFFVRFSVTNSLNKSKRQKKTYSDRKRLMRRKNKHAHFP